MKRFTQYTLGLTLSLFSLSAVSQNLPSFLTDPNIIYDPCITKNEAKKLVSTDNNTALIFEKTRLEKILKRNKDAMNKLKSISAKRILVLPTSHLDLPNKCKSHDEVQVYFSWIDEHSNIQKR